MAHEPRHALPGNHTSQRASQRVVREPAVVEDLADAVRAMMVIGYRPTVTTGDSFGPIALGDELVTVGVTGGGRWGNHTSVEAQRAAAVLTRDGGEAMVVLHDRVYNVVEVTHSVTAELAGTLNERALARSRYLFAHGACDEREPVIVAVALAGHAYPIAGGGAPTAPLAPVPSA